MAAVASVVLLSLQLIARAPPVQRIYAKLTRTDLPAKQGEDVEATGNPTERPSHVARLGGPVIFAFKVSRLLCSVALLALSITSLAISGTQGDDEYSHNSRWVAFGLVGTYVRSPTTRLNA